MGVLTVIGWLMFVVVIVFGRQNYCTIEEASSRVQVTVEGSTMMWQLLWNNTTAVSDRLIHYSVCVYTSPPAEQSKTASEVTTETSFDLDTLSLKEGTYYVQVEANIEGVEGSICSEVTQYNATSSGNTSHGTSLTTLLVTISCVLAAATSVGSVLFALTMWRIRAQGRRQHTRRDTHSQLSMKKSSLSHTFCPCSCGRKQTTRSAAQTDRNRERVQVKSRDKHKRLPPLHLARRDIITTNHSGKAAGNSNEREKGATNDELTNDLPYGYLSPAEINMPKFFKKSPVPNNNRSSDVLQHPLTTRMYVNITRESSSSEPVQYVKSVERGRASSLSDSIYSLPCSLSADMEEEEEVYDNVQQYLEIIPP